MATFFTLDPAAANYPGYNWDVHYDGPNKGVYWQTHARAGAGPSGGDAIELALIPHATFFELTCGFYLNDPAHCPVVAQGGVYYVRQKLKVVSGFDALASNGERWGGKQVILGQGGPDAGRIIWNLDVDPAAGGATTVPRWMVDRNIEGVGIAYQLPVDAWVTGQLKVQSSSSTSTPDGYLALYIDADNADEGTPTVQSAPMTIDTSGWDESTMVGHYYKSLAIGRAAAYQLAAFEVGDTFRSDWFSGAAPEPARLRRALAGGI